MARQAKILVSTARSLPVVRDSKVRLDALLRSSADGEEVYKTGDLTVEPNLVVTTQGIRGGEFGDGRRYLAEIIPQSEIVDTYGCGDSFAAGLTYALGQGLDPEAATRLASHTGATAARRRGAFGN